MTRFELGQVVATPGALAALTDANQDPQEFVTRHQSGDWGEVDEADRKENEFSVNRQLRLMSVYRTAKGVTLWLITEADRSATTILLPDEY